MCNFDDVGLQFSSGVFWVVGGGISALAFMRVRGVNTPPFAPMFIYITWAYIVT